MNNPFNKLSSNAIPGLKKTQARSLKEAGAVASVTGHIVTFTTPDGATAHVIKVSVGQLTTAVKYVNRFNDGTSPSVR